MDSSVGDIDAWLAEGLRHYSGGEPARALDAWYRILDVDPAHALAQQYVAYVQEVYRLEPAGGPRPAAAPVAQVAVPERQTAGPGGSAPGGRGYVEAAATFPSGSPNTSSWSDLVDSAFDVPVPPQNQRPGPPVATDALPANPWAPKARAPGVAPAEVPAPPFLAPQRPAALGAVPTSSPAVDPWGTPSSPAFDPWAGATPPPDPVPIPPPALPLPPPTSPGDDDWSEVAFIDDVPSPAEASLGSAHERDLGLGARGPALPEAASEPVDEASAWSGTYRLKGGGKTEIGGDIRFAGDDAGLLPAIAPGAQPDAWVHERARPAPGPASSAAPDDVVMDEVTIDPWGGDAQAPPLDLDLTLSEPNALDALLGTSTSPAVTAAGDVEVDLDVDGSAIVEEDESEALMRGARELFELGDFSGSLELVEKVLSKNPNHEGALSYLHRNEQTLMKMFESKIGALNRSPRPLMPPDEVIWLNMHHKAGFLLSQVDGQLSYDELIDVSGMPRFNTLRILSELVQQGIIG